MHTLGEPTHDITSPDAPRIQVRVLRTSPLSSAELVVVRRTCEADAARLPASARPVDVQGLLPLLCEVVTRSGWAWQFVRCHGDARSDR